MGAQFYVKQIAKALIICQHRIASIPGVVAGGEWKGRRTIILIRAVKRQTKKKKWRYHTQ